MLLMEIKINLLFKKLIVLLYFLHKSNIGQILEVAQKSIIIFVLRPLKKLEKLFLEAELSNSPEIE